MSQPRWPRRPFFTATDLDDLSVTTALIEGDILTIAKDDHAVSLPPLVALEIAEETMQFLLDEDDITNCQGLSLSKWLGDEDSEQLRRSCRGSAGQTGRHS